MSIGYVAFPLVVIRYLRAHLGSANSQIHILHTYFYKCTNIFPESWNKKVFFDFRYDTAKGISVAMIS